MNIEKIKEITKMAWEQRELISKHKPLDDCFTEKFAELLIKECIACCKPYPNQSEIPFEFEQKAYDSCIEKIKNNFGID